METQNDDVVIDAIKLIEKTYAATLEPEQLIAFEKFWEAYLDNYLADPSENVDQTQINTHIMLALDILKRVQHTDPSQISAEKLVEDEPGHTLIMDIDGAIVASNDQATLMISGCRSVWDLELDHEAARRLKEWISKGRTATGQAPLFVHSHVLGSDRKHCFFVTPVVLDHVDKQHLLLSRIDTDFASNVLSSIQATYDLSAAEADVAAKLTNGMSPTEVAEARGASIHTVRTQIKRLLKKTDTRKIPDLVRVVSGISARLNSTKLTTTTGAGSEAEDRSLLRKGSMTLPGGRRLEFIEQGHPNGAPVIFLHSLITDVGLSRRAARQAVLAGLRFITPIRAGYGESDPNPLEDLDHSLDAAATDLKMLLQHLGIDSAVLVSGWAACFAQRFALRYPELVRGMLLLRCVPLWNDDYLPGFRPRYRNILKSSIFLPHVVPYLAKLGKILMDTGRELTFAKGMNRERPVDLKALENPEIFETVARSYNYISRQGVDTFVAEMRTVHTNWDDDATRLTTPTSIIVEQEYLDYPKRAFDHYMQLVQHARLREVKGAGEYLYLTHFDVLLDEIDKLRSQAA